MDNTEQNSFILSIIVNVDSDIFAVALLKTDSIDMEIIEQSKEKNQQQEVNNVKDLNKMRWFQTLPNSAGFCWGIRSLSLVGETIVCPSMVYESYETSEVVEQLGARFDSQV